MFKSSGHKGSNNESSKRATRARKVSQRMAVVDESTRQQVMQSRLDALENDNEEPAADLFGLDDADDEFVLESSEDEQEGRKSKKRKAGAKRKTRGQLADARGPRTFAKLLEDSGIADAPADAPNYLTAAAPASTIYTPRKFCSVCGYKAPYTCSRCGSRFCSRKCSTLHTETRCLKFMA